MGNYLDPFNIENNPVILYISKIQNNPNFVFQEFYKFTFNELALI